MSKINSKIEAPKNNDLYQTKLIRVSMEKIGELIDYIYKNQGIIISITNSPNPNYKDVIVRYKNQNLDFYYFRLEW